MLHVHPMELSRVEFDTHPPALSSLLCARESKESVSLVGDDCYFPGIMQGTD